MNTRLEFGAYGSIEMPCQRLWGAQTQRSLQNFAISTERQRPLALRVDWRAHTKEPVQPRDPHGAQAASAWVALSAAAARGAQ